MNAALLMLLFVQTPAALESQRIVFGDTSNASVLAGPGQSWSSGQLYGGCGVDVTPVDRLTIGIYMVPYQSNRGSRVRTGQPPLTDHTDRTYWSLVLAHAALTVADIELTMHLLEQPGAQEANPLFPGRPNRVLLYGVGAAMNVFVAHSTRRLRTRHSPLWWIPLASGIGAHSFGVAWNLTWQ